MLQYLLSKLLSERYAYIRFKCINFTNGPVLVIITQYMLLGSCLFGFTQHRLKINYCCCLGRHSTYCLFQLQLKQQSKASHLDKIIIIIIIIINGSVGSTNSANLIATAFSAHLFYRKVVFVSRSIFVLSDQIRLSNFLFFSLPLLFNTGNILCILRKG